MSNFAKICSVPGAITLVWTSYPIFNSKPMENSPKKTSAFFIVCLVIAFIISLILIFETFRYLNDFAPQWYGPNDHNLIIGGIVILIIGLAVSLTLFYFRKTKIIGSILYVILVFVGVFTIFGLEDNIKHNKEQLDKLSAIKQNRIEELEEQNQIKDEEIDKMIQSVSQLQRENEKLQSQYSNAKVRATQKQTQATSTQSSNGTNSDIAPETIATMMESYCRSASENLPATYDIITIQKINFNGKEIIIDLNISDPNRFKSLERNKSSLKSTHAYINIAPGLIPFMKEGNIGLRYIYRSGNNHFDIYYSPKELKNK